jgi:hypothetical protein
MIDICEYGRICTNAWDQVIASATRIIKEAMRE